ncbi:unnamed protein product [Rhizophagus irregularis]|nr:unnamed protein product [Rhizophagus irregularis]
MENYFLPANTKEKQTHDQVNNANKRKNKSNQDDNLAGKKQKTASAPKPSWLLTYEWLEYQTIEDTTFMICAWCEKAKFINQMAKGITIYKKDLLDRHLKVKDHSIAEKNQKESQNKIAVGFAKQYGKEKGIIVRQMQCVYFTAKNHISLEIYPKLCELIMPSQNQNIIAPKVVALPRQLVDNTNSTRSSYGTYQNHNSGKEMEKSITSIIKQELYQEINDSPFWSIMIDETTSISDEKHLAIVSKHFSHNVPVLRYIGLIELEDCTANNILTQILEFIQNNGLNLDNLIHFGSDGASTMVDDFVHFAKALVHSLQARFPCNDLYDSMKILDPKELPLQESALSSYGIEELKLICEHFGNQKHKSNGIPVQPLINSSECKKEWQMVKHIMKSIRNYDIIEGWHHIWSTRPQFKNQFPNVNILVNIVLLVPLLNANVERVFSQHKLTKTRLRNRLNVETLDMHLTILLNAPDNIEEFNWDKAFNQWKNEHV